MTVPNPLPSIAVMACFLLSVLPSEHVKEKASLLFGDLIAYSENELTFLVSMDGCWHQFNTNRNPHLGAQWRRRLYSVQTAQLWYSTAVEQHSSEVALLCPSTLLYAALPCSAPHLSASLCLLCFSETLLVFQFQPRKCSLVSSVERESVLPEPEGSCVIEREVLLLIHDWSILMQMRTPNPHSLIGPHCPHWS